MSERPGREIPKEYRAVALHLVTAQGWRYRVGKGHPQLLPVDRSQAPLAVPTTPSASPRALLNFLGEVRRRGGIWPPSAS